jgi:hypothetical protein
MADTVEPAAPLSPEEQQDAASSEGVEEQRDAGSANGAANSQNAGPGGPEDGAAQSEDETEKPEEETEEPEDARSVTELFEQLGHELSDLGVYEARLEAARNLPDVRRATRDIVGALVAVLAALTAFAFANVAALDGLSRHLATWLAALVLAAFWIAVAGVLMLVLMPRARRWLFWILLRAPQAEDLEELERERDAAGRAARTTLEALGPALAVQIALAAVPTAGDVAGDVAGGVVDMGDGVLDASEETIAVLTEQIPGGGVVNQVWAVALTPGRLGIRVATTALRRGRPVD